MSYFWNQVKEDGRAGSSRNMSLHQNNNGPSKMSQATVWNFGFNRTLTMFGENLMKIMVNFSKSWLNSAFTLLWLPLATSSPVAGSCQTLKHSSCSLLVPWWAVRILSSSNEGCEFWLMVAAFDYCGHDRAVSHCFTPLWAEVAFQILGDLRDRTLPSPTLGSQTSEESFG